MKRRLDDSNSDGRNVKPKLAPAESLKLGGRALDWDTCRYILCDFLQLESYGTLWMTSKSHRDMVRRVLPLVTVAKAQSLYDRARDPVTEALGLSLLAENCTSLQRLNLGYADLLGGRA